MSNIKELKDMTIDQLESFIDDLNKELFELKNQLAVMRKIEKPHLIKDKRRDRARAIMVLADKKKEDKK